MFPFSAQFDVTRIVFKNFNISPVQAGPRLPRLPYPASVTPRCDQQSLWLEEAGMESPLYSVRLLIFDCTSKHMFSYTYTFRSVPAAVITRLASRIILEFLSEWDSGSGWGWVTLRHLLDNESIYGTNCSRDDIQVRRHS